MYTLRYKQIPRLTSNTTDYLQTIFTACVHHKFCTRSDAKLATHHWDCYQSPSQTSDLNVRSQKRGIGTSLVEQKGSKYASNALPAKKRVVVCGGGVMGAAVAYHLGLAGWADDTVVLEKGRCVEYSTPDGRKSNKIMKQFLCA